MTQDPKPPRERIATYVALAERAAPGPWHVETNRHPTTFNEEWGAIVARRHPVGGAGDYPRGTTLTWQGASGHHNAAFIASARLAVPDLAAIALAALDEKEAAERDFVIACRERDHQYEQAQMVRERACAEVSALRSRAEAAEAREERLREAAEEFLIAIGTCVRRPSDEAKARVDAAAIALSALLSPAAEGDIAKVIADAQSGPHVAVFRGGGPPGVAERWRWECRCGVVSASDRMTMRQAQDNFIAHAQDSTRFHNAGGAG